MIDDRQEELAAMHSMGLLDGDERERFMAEIAGNPELRRRVSELGLVAAELALLSPPVEPPAELRARILASAAARENESGRTKASSPSEDNRIIAFPSWIPWLAAASIGIAAVWSERNYLAAQNEISSLRDQQRVSQLALGQARIDLDRARLRLADSNLEVAALGNKLRAENDLARFKIATLASLLGNSPAALAVAVWDPAQEKGVLTVSKLPAAASEKDYQLWVIDAQYAAPVSAGTFVVDPATGEAHVVFKADKPVRSIAKFAVSLERKGGAPEPQGPIVLVSK